MCIYILFLFSSEDIPKILSKVPEYLHKNLLTISSIEYTKHCYFFIYISLSSCGDGEKNSRDFPVKLTPLILATILLPVGLTSSHDASMFVTSDLPIASNLPFSLFHCIHCYHLSPDL